MVKCPLISSPYPQCDISVSTKNSKNWKYCQISRQKRLSNISITLSLGIGINSFGVRKNQGIGIRSSGLKEKFLYCIDIKIFSLVIYWSIGNWQNRHKDKRSIILASANQNQRVAYSGFRISCNLIIIRME